MGRCSRDRFARRATGSWVQPANFRRKRISNQFPCSARINSCKTRFHYGLWLSFNHLDYSCWSGHRCACEAADAWEGSWRLHYHHAARHRRRVRRHVDRKGFHGFQLCRRLDYVSSRRDGFVAALSTSHKARTVRRGHRAAVSGRRSAPSPPLFAPGG